MLNAKYAMLNAESARRFALSLLRFASASGILYSLSSHIHPVYQRKGSKEDKLKP